MNQLNDPCKLVSVKVMTLKLLSFVKSIFILRLFAMIKQINEMVPLFFLQRGNVVFIRNKLNMS